MQTLLLLILGIFTALCSLAGLILSLVSLSRTKRQDISDDLARQRNELNSRMDSMQNTVSASLSAGLNAGNTAQMNAITKFSQETQATLNTFSARIDRMNDTTEKRLLATATWYCGSATAAKMPTIKTTTNSSMSVKPCFA